MPASADFAPFLGKSILFGDTALQLRSVETHGAAAFTLILSGPPAPVLPEGSYEASGDGRMFGPIHIMPIHTPVPDRQDYQVVFN